MTVLYIKEQGAYIKKIGERIIVSKNDRQLLDIPIFHVENIALIGNIQVTAQALHLLMENGVDISYLTYSGKYLGHTAAESSKNIFLRFQQYQYYLDNEKRVKMAKIITQNKIKNQMTIIKNHRWTGVEYDWHSDIKQMEQCLDSLSEKKTTNEVMGIEGICSQIYFRSFGKMLKCDIRFDGRNRRPPRDPVNVILSLGYTLLTKEVCNALDAESFEPYLGFLHGIRYGRKSLGLDMVEEFRQPIIDRLVILLFNKKMLNIHDFECSAENQVILTEDGFKKFCREYEKWMTGKNSMAGNSSFRNQIRIQVNILKKSMSSEPFYTPYSWKDKNVCD